LSVHVIVEHRFSGNKFIMRYLTWLLRAILFLLLLGFALKNDQPVVLKYFFGYEWQTSLVVALLCFFTLGVLVGLLAMLDALFRKHRELSGVRRELKLKDKLVEIGEQVPPITHPSENSSDGI
jgi:putative membrane protein